MGAVLGSGNCGQTSTRRASPGSRRSSRSVGIKPRLSEPTPKISLVPAPSPTLRWNHPTISERGCWRNDLRRFPTPKNGTGIIAAASVYADYLAPRENTGSGDKRDRPGRNRRGAWENRPPRRACLPSVPLVLRRRSAPLVRGVGRPLRGRRADHQGGQHLVEPTTWPSGVSGVFVTFPEVRKLDKSVVEDLLGRTFGVSHWDEVSGPDSIRLR